MSALETQHSVNQKKVTADIHTLNNYKIIFPPPPI